MESKTLKIIALVSAIAIMVIGAAYVFSGSFIPPGAETTGIATYSFWEPENGNPTGTPITVNFTLFYIINDTVYYLNSTMTHEITLDISIITSEYNASGLYFTAEKEGYPVYGALVTPGNNSIALYGINNFTIGLNMLDGKMASNTTTVPAGNHTLEFYVNLPMYFAIDYWSADTIPNASIWWYTGLYNDANITLEGFYVKLSSNEAISITGDCVIFYPFADKRTVYLFDITGPVNIECSDTVTISYGYGKI